MSEKLGDACEAIVFVFDSGDAGSFKAIEAWAEFVETYSPNVLLLVGNETRPVLDMRCSALGLIWCR